MKLATKHTRQIRILQHVQKFSWWHNYAPSQLTLCLQGTGNWLSELPTTVRSCSRHGVVAAGSPSERPGNAVPVSKHVLCWQYIRRARLKCDGTRAETRFSLSAKRTSPFKSAGGRQFSRLLAAELCASAVVMLDTPCSEVVWRVLATHCIYISGAVSSVDYWQPRCAHQR